MSFVLKSTTRSFHVVVFLGRQLQRRAVRVEEARRALSAAARNNGSPHARPDRRSSACCTVPSGLHHDADLGDEILGVARAGIDVPAARELLAHEVDLAGGQLAAERRLRLRGGRRGGRDLRCAAAARLGCGDLLALGQVLQQRVEGRPVSGFLVSGFWSVGVGCGALVLASAFGLRLGLAAAAAAGPAPRPASAAAAAAAS